ncbi:MAG: ribosome silencing factor [Deltaproteobacteria bacterium]|nr:ribosome silencing factor [Deltaproteobacteria bacterium]
MSAKPRKSPAGKPAPRSKFKSKAPAKKKVKGKAGGRAKKPAAPRKKKPVTAVAAAAVVPNPEAEALARRIGALALDKKALDVTLIDVRGKTSYADYFVIASGESDRQVAAIAEHIETTLKAEKDLHSVGTEGRETGNWVLLDYGDVVVHLFFSEQRAFYDLDGLWADARREVLAG